MGNLFNDIEDMEVIFNVIGLTTTNLRVISCNIERIYCRSLQLIYSKNLISKFDLQRDDEDEENVNVSRMLYLIGSTSIRDKICVQSSKCRV